MTTLLEQFRSNYSATQDEEMTLEEYLDLCKRDPAAYATAAERMLAGIGEPELVDTRNDPRLSRIFGNRVIRRYPAFREFYGMEDAIEQIVAFFQHAAQGLEEKKQILYLLGPVGGGKSSIAERLKSRDGAAIRSTRSRARRSTSRRWGCSRPSATARCSRSEYGIPRRYLTGIMSPWAIKRLQEFGGDMSRSSASCASQPVGAAPGRDHQDRAGRREQPGHLARWSARSTSASSSTTSQNDPDAYSYSGGLCLANQGLLEFVEMFKAPIKMLHPLLTATQEGNFKGTEGFSAIPFNGVILAHSQRVGVAQLPQQQEQRGVPRPHLHRQGAVLPAACRRKCKIYQKLLANSSLAKAPCAPGTLDMMAQFSVLSRLKEPENSSIYSKMRVYDGETLKDVDPEGQDAAGVPRLRRRRRRHDRHVDALRVQGAVGGLQLRPDRDRRQPGPPDVRARAAPRARGPARRDAPPLPRASSRAISRRATPSSSARRSRPRTSSRTPSTARTSSTAT